MEAVPSFMARSLREKVEEMLMSEIFEGTINVYIVSRLEKDKVKSKS